MKPAPSHLSPNGIRLLLGDILDTEDYYRLSDQAITHQKVERKWKRKFRESIFEAAFRALDDLAQTGELNEDNFDFDGLVVENAIDAMAAGLKKPRLVPTKLAKKPALHTIFEMWDRWRKKPSTAQKKNGTDIKKLFLHTVQQFWKTNSGEFRRGDTYDMQAAKDAFAKRARIVVARADMIVQTESCRNYVAAIQILYKSVDSITHYLFVSILDKRCTAWCKTRAGLVYKKGTEIQIRELPPIHWNCRSTILPLSPSNPKHKLLIDDRNRKRENRTCAPLPRGWNEE